MQKYLNAINEERNRQDTKFGQQDHSLELWYTILGEEVGEVGKEICEYAFSGKHEYYKGLKTVHLHNLKEELVQVAAVCVAMLESIERNEEIQESQQLQTQQLPESY